MKEKKYIASGYGDKEHPDIILFSSDGKGRMKVLDSLLQSDSPSFLYKMENHIFAVAEQKDMAAIISYRMEDKRLLQENRIEFEGAGLCHLCGGNGVLYASCYGSGELYVVDSSLGKVMCCYRGSEKSHMHSSILWNEETLLAVDLGESQLIKFCLKDGIPDSEPEIYTMKKDSGPRQILFEETKKRVIVINELNNTVCFGNGEHWYENLRIRTATEQSMAPNYPGGGCMDENGTVFLANRGADTIAVFDRDNRFLGEWSCGGKWPRHLLYSREGIVFAACQRSNTVNSFLWNGKNLTASASIVLEGAACVIEV